jgi:HAD superfamily hydrolase (TIGR01509 family)
LKFAALIFDCDGTLVDSERIATEVIAEVAGEHGVIYDIESAYREFRGARMIDCVARVEQMRGSPVPDDFVPDIRRRMEIRFRRDLQAIAGADELLRTLSLPICVASNGPYNKTELNLRLTGLLRYFGNRIFSAHDVGHWKPKPDLFLHAAQAMNVQAHTCAVIEDSEPGVAAALAAGMHVFALRNEHLSVTQSQHITPVDSLFHLKELLPDRLANN